MTASRRLGKYEILEEIGRGGFAVVYKARDTTLNRVVALKVLHPQLTIDPKFVQRFQQEAQTAARLRHPHIVTIHEVGEEGGQHYLAMSFLPGHTLDERLSATRGPLPVELAISIIEQIADALDTIHQQGLVHRDIKPANIMVDNKGQATLLDFGIVRAAEGTRLTTTMAVLGTPEYMAPEQAELHEGVAIDWRADIYALGVVAYEMLVGRPPFTGKSPTAILHKHVYEPPPEPTTLNPNLPTGLEPVLLKALAKRREERFQQAGTLAAELRHAPLTDSQVRQREAQLASLYQQLQVAAAQGNWRGVLALGGQILALDASYRDVSQRMAHAQGQLHQPRRAPTEPAPAQPTPQPQPARATTGAQMTAEAPRQGISRRRFLYGALIVGGSIIGCGAVATMAALMASSGWPSCNGPSSEGPTQTPKPTDMFTDTPTLMDMPTPTDASTLTDTPTHTPRPTDTPRVTDTPTPTGMPTPDCTVLPEGVFLSIWQSNSARQAALGCPTSNHPRIAPAAWEVQTSYQPFEHGAMIWSDHIGWYEKPIVYVLYGDDTFEGVDDTFNPDTDPTSGGETPPAGLFEPVLQFGKVWREEQNVRAALGWAIAEEVSGAGRFQLFVGGNMIWLSQRGETVILLSASSTYVVESSPTFE